MRNKRKDEVRMREKRRFLGMVLAGALVLGMVPVSEPAAAKVSDGTMVLAAEAATGSAVTGEAVTPTVQTGEATLNINSVNRMKGKKFKLVLSNIPAGAVNAQTGLQFVPDDTTVALVSESSFSTDFTTATATVDLVGLGTTTIRVNVNGQEYTCDVNVVRDMGKIDFGKYNTTNFLDYCKKHGSWKWAWTGEWGVPMGKYGSTYRKIKIGDSMEDVIKAYGELKLKDCKKATSGKKGDPFLYEKQFNNGKILKVSKYADFSYGKYKLRFYFTPAKKVFGFTMTMGFKNITKDSLRKNSKLKMV